MKSLTDSVTVKARRYGTMALNTKGHGRTTKQVALVYFTTQTAMYIKDTGNTIKRMEKAFTLAQMVVVLKVTGLTM